MVSSSNGHDCDFHERDVAYIAPGQVDLVEQFPYEIIDARLSGLSSKVPPIEQPENFHRDLGLKFFGLLDCLLVFILKHPRPHLAAWTVAIALGRTSLTGGATQEDIARRFGISRAAVNKGTKKLQAQIGLAPMPGQRTLNQCQKFSRVRKNKLTRQSPHQK